MRQQMKFLVLGLFFPVLVSFGAEKPNPEYVRLEMTIDVNVSAKKLWSVAGGYCDIGRWANIECEIISGDGGIGTIRVLMGGEITEVMVSKTNSSYGYAQPPEKGKFYNFYHGFMEARPLTNNSSKLTYTVIYDISELTTKFAKDKDMTTRRQQFNAALQNIKVIAENEN